MAKGRNINKNKQNKKGKKARSLVGLAVTSGAAVLLAVTVAALVLFYYFAPPVDETVTVNVPSYIGMDEQNAVSDSQFLVEKEWVESENAQKGKVISQHPSANAKRKLTEGERIKITLRIGAGEKKNTVPDVSGLEYMSAASMLRAMGARVRTVAIYDGVGENGRVIYSSPRANAPLERGQTVTLFVKRARANKPVLVPDLVGKPMNDACAEMLKIGLRLGNVEYAYSSDGEGTVIFQSVPDGIYVTHGTRIDITVGLGASDTDEDIIDGGEPETEELETETEAQSRWNPFGLFGFG